jgi:hypothetical protein
VKEEYEQEDTDVDDRVVFKEIIGRCGVRLVEKREGRIRTGKPRHRRQGSM